MYVNECLYVCMYVCTYVCMHACMHAYIYKYVHIYLHICKHIYVYPPTPAFAKAGAAPGTTVGVELLPALHSPLFSGRASAFAVPGTQATALCC